MNVATGQQDPQEAPRELTALEEFKRGWLVLAATFVGVALSITVLAGYTGGIFLGPIENEFGWSRSAISAQSIFGIAVLAVSSPYVGLLIDRIGIRKIVFASFVAYAVGLFMYSLLFDSLIFYFSLSFFVTLFAAGATPVAFTRAITGWFDKARGLALGISLMGAGLTSALAPILLNNIIEEQGWRAAYRVLSLTVLCGAVFVATFIRSDPHGTTQQTSQAVPESDRKPGFDAREGLRSSTFAVLSIAFLLVSMSVGGILVHFIPMLTDEGMSRAEAARYASVMGLSVMAGRLVTGAMIDRFFAPMVSGILFSIAVLGYVSFLIGGAEMALMAAIAVGFTLGAEVDLIGYLISRYFGLRSYGVLYGVMYAIFITGAGLAPIFMGLAFDVTGSYQIALVVSSLALGIAAIMMFLMKPYPDFTGTTSTSASNQSERHPSRREHRNHDGTPAVQDTASNAGDTGRPGSAT